jgi:hypothetical protein
MRRAGDHGDPVGDRGAGDLQAVLDRVGAVVDPVEDVRVEVAHPPRRTMWA